jgi:hypothetical protein
MTTREKEEEGELLIMTRNIQDRLRTMAAASTRGDSRQGTGGLRADSPARERSLLNFDERDLLTFAERAGLAEMHLELHATIKQPKPLDSKDEPGRPTWETLLKSSGNPLSPTLEEAMAQALSPQEAEQFTAHLCPLVETMQCREQQAVACLRAAKC